MSKSRVNVNSQGRPKTTCPLTTEEFFKNAKPLTVIVNGIPIIAKVKHFSKGSFGWYATGKITVEVGGEVLSVQVGGNFTCIGSKLDNKPE